MEVLLVNIPIGTTFDDMKNYIITFLPWLGAPAFFNASYKRGWLRWRDPEIHLPACMAIDRMVLILFWAYFFKLFKLELSKQYNNNKNIFLTDF